MSAPRTNIEKQKSRHKIPLMGMGGAIALAAVLMAVFLVWLAWTGNAPQGADEQIEGRTGEVLQD